MKRGFSPQKVLITGASSGMGAALAKLCAAKGFSLIVTGRNEEALQELKQSLSTLVEIVVADLSCADGLDRLLHTVRAHAPDLVINNAGLGYYGEAILKEADEVIQVNVKAVTDITIAAANALRGKNAPGIICNISSVLAFQPTPFMSVYAASKAFVTSFSQAEDTILQPYGIRVLSSCLGAVESDFVRRAAHNLPSTHRPWFSLSAEEAAKAIWEQIEAEDSMRVIDWRTRALLLLSKLIPQKWRLSFVSRDVVKRLAR